MSASTGIARDAVFSCSQPFDGKCVQLSQVSPVIASGANLGSSKDMRVFTFTSWVVPKEELKSFDNAHHNLF